MVFGLFYCQNRTERFAVSMILAAFSIGWWLVTSTMPANLTETTINNCTSTVLKSSHRTGEEGRIESSAPHRKVFYHRRRRRSCGRRIIKESSEWEPRHRRRRRPLGVVRVRRPVSGVGRPERLDWPVRVRRAIATWNHDRKFWCSQSHRTLVLLVRRNTSQQTVNSFQQPWILEPIKSLVIKSRVPLSFWRSLLAILLLQGIYIDLYQPKERKRKGKEKKTIIIIMFGWFPALAHFPSCWLFRRLFYLFLFRLQLIAFLVPAESKKFIESDNALEGSTRAKK